MFQRPDKSEYNPYFDRYISAVGEQGAIPALRSSDFLNLMVGLSDQEWNYRYAEGKWSIKEVLVHIMDTERIFAYRLLRISRNDATPLAGFEQDGYIENAEIESRTIASLLAEYKAVRDATLSLIDSLDVKALSRKGTASGSNVSARALVFMIAGHEIHHHKIVEEKYLS